MTDTILSATETEWHETRFQTAQRLVKIAESRVARATGCRHQAREAVDRGYVGPVQGWESGHYNPAAQGGICRRETCHCGATRDANLNGRHQEQGDWVLDSLYLAANLAREQVVAARERRDLDREALRANRITVEDATAEGRVLVNTRGGLEWGSIRTVIDRVAETDPRTEEARVYRGIWDEWAARVAKRGSRE